MKYTAWALAIIISAGFVYDYASKTTCKGVGSGSVKCHNYW